MDLRLKGACYTSVPPNVKYDYLFTRLQREAREAGRPLGGGRSHTTPAPASGGKSDSAAKYIGSSNSKKFHYPDC